MGETIAALVAAHDAARAALHDASAALTEAMRKRAAAQIGPGWEVYAYTSGAQIDRMRRAGGSYPPRAVVMQWSPSASESEWHAWAVHEGRDSDRCGKPDPVTESVTASTPAGAMLALAALVDGMAQRSRLPRRTADLRHLAQYCRDLAASMPEVSDG